MAHTGLPTAVSLPPYKAPPNPSCDVFSLLPVHWCFSPPRHPSWQRIVPGHPAALGTSWVITVDPTHLPRVGTMQYRHTLPLRNHEVVLTFDDGPLPPSTTRVLDTLRAKCVQATFFIVGSIARAHPDLVRRANAESYTIATHSQHHRVLGRASAAAVERDFESEVELVAAALGNRKAVAPFYRFPGLGRSAALEQHLASHGVMA